MKSILLKSLILLAVINPITNDCKPSTWNKITNGFERGMHFVAGTCSAVIGSRILHYIWSDFRETNCSITNFKIANPEYVYCGLAVAFLAFYKAYDLISYSLKKSKNSNNDNFKLLKKVSDDLEILKKANDNLEILKKANDNLELIIQELKHNKISDDKNFKRLFKNQGIIYSCQKEFMQDIDVDFEVLKEKLEDIQKTNDDNHKILLKNLKIIFGNRFLDLGNINNDHAKNSLKAINFLNSQPELNENNEEFQLLRRQINNK